MSEDLLKHKSKIFREEKTLVFKFGDFEKRWNEFLFIPSARFVCEIFRNTYKIESFEEYCEENLGKNSSGLDSFMNRKNRNEHDYNLRIEYDLQSKKLMYVGFYKTYGITPSNFKKIFNHIMREIWEIKPYFSQFCYIHKKRIEGKRRVGFVCIDEQNVALLHKNVDLLNETKKNNQENLNPFVFYSGMKTSELKKLFTKSLWKKLCENSFSRNKLIVIKLKNILCDLDLNSSFSRTEVNRLAEYYNAFPSAILKFPYIEVNDASIALANCCTAKEFKEEYNYNNESLYRKIDTIINFYKNEKDLLNWSKEQWLSKHKEVTNQNTPF